MTTYPLLDTINHPARLRELTVEQLPVLAEELRRFLIESVAQTARAGRFSWMAAMSPPSGRPNAM